MISMLRAFWRDRGTRGAMIAAGVGGACALLGGLAPAVVARATLSGAHAHAAELDLRREQALRANTDALAEIHTIETRLAALKGSALAPVDVHGAVDSVVELAESEGLSVGRVDLGSAAQHGGAESFSLELAGEPGRVGTLLSRMRRHTPFVSVRSLRIAGSGTSRASLSLEWSGTGEAR